MDEALAIDEKIGHNEVSRMPVFGIKKSDSALFAVIENGDAIAEVFADISGKVHKYNTVGSQFTVLPKDEVKLGTRETIIKTPKETYSGDITIRYAFLNDEDANYSGMANYYRVYLQDKYSLDKLENDDIPLFLELTGVISKENSFLGISYDEKIALTNLAQAKTIIEGLKDREIDNINVIYKGWFNGGVEHRIPTKVKLERKLGSKREWKIFVDEMKEQNINIYPDVSLLRVYKESQAFRPSRHAALQLSRKITKIYEFNPATYRKEYDQFSHFILSTNAIDLVWDKFLGGYKKYGVEAVSLRDIGMDLSSDFRQKNPMTRQSSADKIKDKTGDIYEEIPNIVMHGGNIYMLPYTHSIVDVPQDSNNFAIADESIPFYEMVLHGYIDYTGRPFNLSSDQDMREGILKSLETGSNVYYSWIGSKPSKLKGTRHYDLYSHYYAHWIDEAIESYKEINSVLKDVRGEHIVLHENLGDHVYRTHYSNGTTITVNYSDKDMNIEGQIIEARGYQVE